MAAEFNNFINRVFIPALFQQLDTAFPEMGFIRKGNDWHSPLKKDGTQPRRPNKAKTVIKGKAPYLVFEGGEAPEEIVKWIKRRYGFATAYEAVKAIGDKIGIIPPHFDSDAYKGYLRRVEAYCEAATEMQAALFSDRGTNVLRQLTDGRGYTIDEIRQMGLGYIDSDIAAKYRELVFLPRGVEKFNQIVIPYYSEGRIEGFKFRATSDEASTKYINSRFSKSQALFGLTAVPMKGALRDERQVILVDGELKALYMTVKGFDNVVSGAGSAGSLISEAQITQAKAKGIRHVILIADNESSAKERENEARKIEESLRMLNRGGLSGYVVYLPHEDLSRKEDVEDYLHAHGAEELRKLVSDPENGAAFRTRLLFAGYESKALKDGSLSAIHLKDLYADLFRLMSEYSGPDLAFIESMAKECLGGNSPEWIEVIRQGAEAANEQRIAQRKEAAARTIAQRVSTAVRNGDIEGVLTASADAQRIISEAQSDKFSSLFYPRKWYDTVARLQHRKMGVDTLYKFIRGRETDILTLPSGALSIIAAPTNHGKSTMLQNLALQSAMDSSSDGAVLYFTFEEDTENVCVQFLSKVIGCPISRDNKRSIKSYYLGHPQYITDMASFKKGETQMSQLIESGKLWIYGTEEVNGITLDAITPLCQMVRQASKSINRGIDAVFMDYVQLITPDEKGQMRAAELKEICVRLKNLAVELSVPIVLAAQFNREAASPYELDAQLLGESGDIERSAALIVGMWNTGKSPMAKSRFPADSKVYQSGSNGLRITFDTSHPRIYARIIKSRGEATGGEALLECDLNVGVIQPNTTRAEITRLRASETHDLAQSDARNAEKDGFMPF